MNFTTERPLINPPLSGAEKTEPSPRRPFFAAFVLLLGFATIACQKPPAAKAPPAPTVEVSRPIQREVTDWDEYTGHLTSPEIANIAARVSGIIEQVPFKEGALVKKNDVLFVLDQRPFKADLDNKRATVAKDEAQVALAQSQLARAEDLLKKRAISQQEYDTNSANFDQAKAQLAADKAAAETAQLNLDWSKVTAPIAGRVGRMLVTAGNLVSGGAGQPTALTTIVSVDPMYCYVPVPERAFLKYQSYAAREKESGVRDAKIPCFVGLENETNYPHEGVVDFIDNTLDPNTGTIQLRGVIQNPSGSLTPGLFAQMRISGSGLYQALLVPDIAVGAEQNERFLLVVNSDGVVETRKVTLGALFGSLRAISGGLKPEEKVIVNGLQLARPGSKVIAQEVPIPKEYISVLDASGSGLASARELPNARAVLPAAAPTAEAKP